MKSADGRFEYQNKDGEDLPDGTPLPDVGRMQFRCRSFRRNRCGVNLGKNAGYQIEKRNWELTGTADHPTITPSINCEGCWHGFIKAGVFMNTNDQPEEKQ